MHFFSQGIFWAIAHVEKVSLQWFLVYCSKTFQNVLPIIITCQLQKSQNLYQPNDYKSISIIQIALTDVFLDLLSGVTSAGVDVRAASHSTAEP